MKAMYKWDFPEKEIRLQKLQIDLKIAKEKQSKAVYENSIYGNLAYLVDHLKDSIRTIENQIIDIEKPE